MCLVRYGKIDYFKPVRSNCTTTKRLKELKIAIEVFHMVFGAVFCGIFVALIENRTGYYCHVLLASYVSVFYFDRSTNFA